MEMNTREKPALAPSTSSSHSDSAACDRDDYHDAVQPNHNVVVVSFEPQDPENPHNWSTRKKAYIVVMDALVCINSTFGSALAAGLVPYFREAWDVPAGPQSILPTSVFLVGFIFGPLIFAPLSESYGRLPIMANAFVVFTLATLGCALAPNWSSFLFFRFLAGTFGSPPLNVGGGVIADLFGDEFLRGRMMMCWGAATFIGPLGAPIVAGFAAPAMGWRWVFWFALIFAGVTLLAGVFVPETLAPAILRKKAARLNKEAGEKNFATSDDLKRSEESSSLWQTMKSTMSRPIVLLYHELLLDLCCIYLAFQYAVFYMLLKIFPSIFQGVYNFSPGISGVAFSMIGLGTLLSLFFCIWYEGYAPRLSAKHPGKEPEYLRLPLACAAGPIFVVSLFWMGWTARSSVHWIVPLISMLPYGAAYQLIFTAIVNYVTDAYPIYAASSLAALGTTRSLAAVLIPLMIDDMLEALGIAWSCSVLAFISAVLALVPFLFIAYGEKIRKRSRFSTAVKHDQAEANGAALTRSLSAV